MDAKDKYIIKQALRLVEASGGNGVTERQLKEHIDLAAGEPLASDKLDEAVEMLKERGWSTWYMEPIWHAKRYTLTPRGMTALEGM